MKIKLVSLFALLSTFSSFGALYSVSNSVGNGSVGITSADGLPGAATVTRGFQTTEARIAFGVFNISDALIQASTDATDLYSSFVQFGTNERSFTATTGGANGVATPTSDSNIAVTGNATFINKNIYLFVSNVSSLASITDSSEVLVLRLNRTFLAADDAFLGTQALTYDNTSATLLVGGYDNFQFKTRTADTSTGAGWNTVALVPIPETSTSLLGAIGALALLRRRRN